MDQAEDHLQCHHLHRRLSDQEGKTEVIRVDLEAQAGTLEDQEAQEETRIPHQLLTWPVGRHRLANQDKWNSEVSGIA